MCGSGRAQQGCSCVYQCAQEVCARACMQEDRWGATPLDDATKTGNTELIALLQQVRARASHLVHISRISDTQCLGPWMLPMDQAIHLNFSVASRGVLGPRGVGFCVTCNTNPFLARLSAQHSSRGPRNTPPAAPSAARASPVRAHILDTTRTRLVSCHARVAALCACVVLCVFVLVSCVWFRSHCLVAFQTFLFWCLF